jgi:N-acetyl-gamma-glutamyl-phosphate/LysW-gamma-L-alpha-aminoadipyl-6-phosphate reductase
VIRASIVGGSGYVGGEVLRLLLDHPEVEVQRVTSESNAGRFVHLLHPNLRGRTRLKFTPMDALEPVDLLFLCLPHGESQRRIESLSTLAPRVIDLAADFRLRSPERYRSHYGEEHACPERLVAAVYGVPELHREAIREAALVTGAGCLATASILGLYPLFRAGAVDAADVYVDAKVGSSAAGNKPGLSTHHPERSGAYRSFAPTGHRHTAEIEQELTVGGTVPGIHFSATAVEAVRGILATSQVRLADDLDEKAVWQIYRDAFAGEPFLRIVKDRHGIYRYPEFKILSGSNYCDVGFEKAPGDSRRLVVLCAIDNLMKGAAGNGVQAMNVAFGFPETTGLGFPGLHPV